jgi:hypothetical protein
LWGARNIIGKPKVYPEYKCSGEGWGQNIYDNNQYIVIKFDDPVYLIQLNIYETYNAGAIIRIKIKNSETNEWNTVWEAPVDAPVIYFARIFTPLLEQIVFKTQEVRLELDCSKAYGTSEIDAVGNY